MHISYYHIEEVNPHDRWIVVCNKAQKKMNEMFCYSCIRMLENEANGRNIRLPIIKSCVILMKQIQILKEEKIMRLLVTVIEVANRRLNIVGTIQYKTLNYMVDSV